MFGNSDIMNLEKINYNLNIESKREELNSNAQKVLKLILYSNHFIYKIRYQIKEGKELFGYLIKNDFREISYLSNYFEIYIE